MQVEFKFLSPARLHPNSDYLTTAQLAQILEGKYGLISGFTDYTIKDLMKRIEKIVHRFASEKVLTKKCLENNFNRELGGWLQNQWRDYINHEKHNIESKAAKEENRQAFVETGDYFKSITVRIRII